MAQEQSEIACSLNESQLRERRRFARSELVPFALSSRLDGRRLQIEFPLEVAAQVREFVRLEETC